MKNFAEILATIPNADWHSLSPEKLAKRLFNMGIGASQDLPDDINPHDNLTRRGIGAACYILKSISTLKDLEKIDGNNHAALIAYFEADELMNAILHGRNHPLLETWLEIRRENKRPAATQRAACLRYQAVGAASILKSVGLTFTKAYKEVAVIANKSGVFIDLHKENGGVTAAAIERWKRDLLTNGVTPMGDYPALNDALGYGRLGANYRNQAGFRFWTSWIQMMFLAFGTASIDQAVLFE